MPATDRIVRKLPVVHRIFAASAVALLVTTIWMLAADYADEWRDIQRKTFDLKAAALRHELALKESPEFQQRIDELQQRLAAADEELQARADELNALKEQIDEAERLVDIAEDRLKSLRELEGVARAEYDLAIRDELPEEEQARRKARYDELSRQVREAQRILDERLETLDQKRQELAALTARRDKVLDELKAARAEVERVHRALLTIKPESWLARAKRKIMEWPIIDGFNSHLRIEQDWLPDLPITLGMAKTARFDRCRTCHQVIDEVAAGNRPRYPFGETDSEDVEQWIRENRFPHPFATHPRPDLYLTESSPHPRARFGCTICHDGQGSGTSFSNASHTPNDPHQEHEWAEHYDYKANHFWEYPMLPERFRESGCLKCHHSVVELGVNPKFGPTAPKLFRGWQLIRDHGCFGCHEIHGFESGEPIGPDLRLEPSTPEEAKRFAEDPNLVPGRMRKVGPSLRHIAEKVTAEWIAYWLENPRRFRPTTRMPHFFYLSNQQDALAYRYQPVQIAAVAQYLMDKSEPFETLHPRDDYKPDAERGRTLFARRGCLACHQHEAFPAKSDERLGADFGPDLTQVPAKLSPIQPGQPLVESQAFRWLYTWIRDPKRYHPRTRMPVLFLEPYTEPGSEGKQPTYVDPAADIAAFLLSPGLREYEAPVIDDAALDELVRLYLPLRTPVAEQVLKTRKYPIQRERIKGDEVELTTPDGSTPSEQQWRRMKLNYVGRRTISQFGCYGCHDIAGFEQARPIGTQLQDWGRKDTSRLALEHIVEYLEQPKLDVLAFELHADERAADVLRDVRSAEAFRQLAETRRSNRALALDVLSLRLVRGEEHPVLGQVDALFELAPGDWTTQPVQHAGRRFLVLVESKGDTHDRVVKAIKRAAAGGAAAGEFPSPEVEERELSAAYFYESLLHHGRPGFIWQKLRDPRSYDYRKTDTKGYHERLRMPAFHFTEDEIEAIATFVLGLVAEPPPAEYLYRPEGPARDRIEGERLLERYNCVGCHMIELPEIAFAIPARDPQNPRGVRDLVGMTVDDLVDWFLEHGSNLRADRLPEADIPDDVKLLARHGADLKSIAQVVADYDLSDEDESETAREALKRWFDEHPLYRLAGPLGDDQYPEGVRRLLALKPPRNGETGRTNANGEAIVRFRGLLYFFDPEELPEFQEYSYDLWETWELGGKIKLPAERILFPANRLVSQTPARGGRFAEWLVDHLTKDRTGAAFNDRSRAWQMVPPPLYLEGRKVQTPWLYQFLKDPGRLRYEAVLRMPRFNLSDEEAHTLANYFAAFDEASYPYQEVPQREPDYLARMDRIFREKYAPPDHQGDYLTESWKVLNGKLCIGCHAVGGREVQGADPKQFVRGPDLRLAGERLRPDFAAVWLSYPKWILPYTSMPPPKPIPELFGGKAPVQSIALRDALMNYHRLMEHPGPIVYIPLEDRRKEAGGGNGDGAEADSR